MVSIKVTDYERIGSSTKVTIGLWVSDESCRFLQIIYLLRFIIVKSFLSLAAPQYDRFLQDLFLRSHVFIVS